MVSVGATVVVVLLPPLSPPPVEEGQTVSCAVSTSVVVAVAVGPGMVTTVLGCPPSPSSQVGQWVTTTVDVVRCVLVYVLRLPSVRI